MEVKVPMGTVVIDDATGVVLADLSHEGAVSLLLRADAAVKAMPAM